MTRDFNACGGGGDKRLGVWSLGFLRQPRLRSALAMAGWQVVPGWSPHDAIGVWGRRPVSQRGIAAADRSGKPLITIEDGFLRSINPGADTPVISLILDDLGIYHDAAHPSRLEHLINAADDVDRAQNALNRLRDMRLSKYNAAPDLAAPPSGHVLVIDQTANDASIRYGSADADSFLRMLHAAEADHPGADIIIKQHPETAMGRKMGHYRGIARGGNTVLWTDPANPWDLIAGAKAVYTVTSQLGFEACLAGVPVRTFGMPFYAGWGATEDELPGPARREQRRSALQIFGAAYLDYPTYFDPWRGGLTGFEDAVDALSLLKSHHERMRQPSVGVGIRLWKRAHVAKFLTGVGGPPVYEDQPEVAVKKAISTQRRVVVWAAKAVDTPFAAPVLRLEDGFLRSSGLGAELVPPLSLALDDEGIYYDPTRPSQIERLIANARDDEPSLQRAARLRANIVALDITKYNLKGRADKMPDPPAGKRIILVPGQVEDDASILKGTSDIRTNLALLEAVRAMAPDAYIIYKPHPDVEVGLRAGTIDPAALTGLADHVATETRAATVLDQVDEVCTMTSLMGFEALLRGRAVTCFGAPFYAGWGLTTDRGDVPDRRTARPGIDQLVHAALIDYPLYLDPVSGLPCPPEVIVERLAAGLGPRPPRVLSKLQGLFASFAPIWR